MISKRGHNPDYMLLALVAALTVFGIAMLASASSELGKLKFDDSYYYLKHQLTRGLAVGIIGFLLGYLLHYQQLRRIAFPLLLVNILALALVFTNLGLEVHGANRWLKLGPISFQPAETMKLVFILYLAAWLSNTKLKRATNFLEGAAPFAVIAGSIGVLLALQPATSTVAILLGSGLIVYFLNGAKLRYIFLILLVGAVGATLLILSTPYRMARILGFINPTADTAGQNYQVDQAKIALGSGGLAGRGYGQSAMKLNLPAAIDDSIFAIAGEELGFIGGVALVALFATLILRLFLIAYRLRDRFGRLILAGFGIVIALQSFVNMAAISGLIPLTGAPLPFISYGGTALAVFMTMGGIAGNISKYT